MPRVSRGANARLIGKIRDDGLYVVKYQGETLVSANACDVTRGIVYDRPHKPRAVRPKPDTQATLKLGKKNLLAVLAHPNLAARKPIEACYDKQVQGRTIIERGEAAAGVMAPFNSADYPPEIRQIGIAVAVAHNPAYGKVDAYQTAYHAIISSARKVVSVGAKPAAFTDCLCFGNPENPEQMQDIIDAIRGIKEACEALPLYDYPSSPTPVISGNVSLYNESEKGVIPASPMVSCLGVLDHVERAVTPAIKNAGSNLILLHDNKTVSAEFSAVIDLASAGLLRACQTVDLGGLAWALMTMSFKQERGFCVSSQLDFFAEFEGFVLEVSPEKAASAKKILNHYQLHFTDLGNTLAEPELRFGELTLSLHEAKSIFMQALREHRQ